MPEESHAIAAKPNIDPAPPTPEFIQERLSSASPDLLRELSRWNEIFGDEIVAAAIVDRLVHHADVIALNGDSHGTAPGSVDSVGVVSQAAVTA